MISRRQFKIQAPPTRSFALSSPRTLAHISQPTIRVPPASANVLDAAFLPLPPTPTEPSLQMDESETRLLRRLRIDDIHAARRPAAPQPLPSPRLVDEPDASLMAFERPTIQPRPSLQQLLDAKSERASSAPLAMTAPARPRIIQPRSRSAAASPRALAREAAAHETAEAVRRASVAAKAATAAISAAEATASLARISVGVDTTSLDPLDAWEARNAPQRASRAAALAEAAKQEAAALDTDARVASIREMAHSERDDVRALGGTHAVQTLTTLASFVKDERLQARVDAAVIGETLKCAREPQVSPFRWRSIGGPAPKLASPARPRGYVRAVAGSHADSPRWRV